MNNPTKHLVILVLTSAVLTAQAACPSWPTADRFTLDGSEVTDNRTGLTWKRCSEGQIWSSTCTGSVTIHTHEAALALAKAANTSQTATGWRLPNVKELASLADKGCLGPAIHSAAFPATPSSYFWSSTPFLGGAGYAWFVDFGRGRVGASFRSDRLLVRLVRASQSLGVPGEEAGATNGGGGTGGGNTATR